MKQPQVVKAVGGEFYFLKIPVDGGMQFAWDDRVSGQTRMILRNPVVDVSDISVVTLNNGVVQAKFKADGKELICDLC